MADTKTPAVATGGGALRGAVGTPLQNTLTIAGREFRAYFNSPMGYIVIAIFDTATGARIENAEVTATVSGLGHVGGRRLELEPMTIAGTVTYGQFVTLPGEDIYDVAVDIRVPDRSSPVRADFTYQHAQ